MKKEWKDGQKFAFKALTALGEAKASGDEQAYRQAYDNYVRGRRMMDIEDYDAVLVDDYGNVCKPANQSHNIDVVNDAWLHELPEDIST